MPGNFHRAAAAGVLVLMFVLAGGAALYGSRDGGRELRMSALD
jgi:hypothetical protein